MEEKSFIYQKLEALFRKHSADGTTPRKLIEANMAREFRICKEDLHKILEEMNLTQEEMKRRRVKRETKVEYISKSPDAYQNDLRASR
jgi:uncharacterized protein YwgA